MKNSCLLLAAFTIFQFLGATPASIQVVQRIVERNIYLTLLPNYETNKIEFDGTVEFRSVPSSPSSLAGFPLAITTNWQDQVNPTWYIRGVFASGELTLDPDSQLYHLRFGPVELQPYDQVHFLFPYVNLDYADIHPAPDVPGDLESELRERIHRFSYSAGESPRTLEQIEIAFAPVRMNIDLILTPLVGESLTGTMNGFRLSGKVRFDAFRSFEELSRYCQDTSQRLEHGDYRMEHLLSALNAPYYASSNGLNPAFQFKPTTMGLRSELLACQYEPEENAKRFVDAQFSGRVNSPSASKSVLPIDVEALVFSNGNYPFEPQSEFAGVNGYQIQLGKVVLGPGDVLNITIPHTRLQVDKLSPMPDHLAYLDAQNAGSQIRISYVGPASFDLSLPYVPETSLYSSQFPANLRPGLFMVQSAFAELFTFDGRWLTWTLLVSGILLLVLSRVMKGASQLSVPAWLFISISFFYGMRGSFGLLCVAVSLYMSHLTFTGPSSKNTTSNGERLLRGLAGFALIALAVYADQRGIFLFSGLAGTDLSPLTPLILMILVGALFLLLYGTPEVSNSFPRSDFPVLGLLLVVPALYDAFDKSLLALLIFLAGGLWILRSVFPVQRSGTRPNETRLGSGLRRRWKLVFGNRIVPLAMLTLLIFAVLNDLSSTFANEMQVLLPPLIAPLVIPVLVFISIFLTLSSIALLFLLVYPFLPMKTGYLKAAVFSLGLFLVFLFGIGTDDRLMTSLPNILVGRVIYYVSVPMLIGVYLDIYDFMKKENKRLSSENAEEKVIDFQTASNLYFKNVRGVLGAVTGVVSLVAPTIYAFLASQPVIVTYFSLLEKLVLLPA